VGCFNIKRELSIAEFNRISASAKRLEIELRESPSQKQSLVPRLINHYFWMVDHLKARGDENGLRSVLLKIKILDQSIYKSYIE